MAGKFRRKFVTIISDKFKAHYEGRVDEKTLSDALAEVETLVARLDGSKQKHVKERAASLSRLKKLPLDKLKELLAAEA